MFKLIAQVIQWRSVALAVVFISMFNSVQMLNAAPAPVSLKKSETKSSTLHEYIPYYRAVGVSILALRFSELLTLASTPTFLGHTPSALDPSLGADITSRTLPPELDLELPQTPILLDLASPPEPDLEPTLIPIDLESAPEPTFDFEPYQLPLVQVKDTIPKLMLNVSKDHKLWTEAYSDHEMQANGVIHTQYMNDKTYDGYFNSDLCYDYQDDIFQPKAAATQHYCDSSLGLWSGNLLNWATTLRIDLLRKALYGGHRFHDVVNQDVIVEAAKMPEDAHAFAKVLDMPYLNQLTPYTQSKITLCVVGKGQTGRLIHQTDSQAHTILRVVDGKFPFWASSKNYACEFGSSSTLEQIATSKQLGNDFKLRIKVCDDLWDTRADYCKTYPNNDRRPIGALQKYGESKKIKFGLVSGSYLKNKEGGLLRVFPRLLRKDDYYSQDEIDTLTGQIKTDGVIPTLDKLAYVNWRFGDKQIDCDSETDLTALGNECRMYGNPLSDMLATTIDYYRGKAEEKVAFQTPDTNYPTQGIREGNWHDVEPFTNTCDKNHAVMIGPGTATSDLTHSEYQGLTHAFGPKITKNENLKNRKAWVGEVITSADGKTVTECKLKTIHSLTDIKNLCHDKTPFAKNSAAYQAAGIAYFAKTTDLRSDIDGTQTVETHAVSLKGGAPKFTFRVSDDFNGRAITVSPMCLSEHAWEKTLLSD